MTWAMIYQTATMDRQAGGEPAEVEGEGVVEGEVEGEVVGGVDEGGGAGQAATEKLLLTHSTSL